MPSEHWIFPPDVTPQVQEKIDILRDTTNRIASMETELTRLRLEKAELEKKLECYRLEVSQVTLGPMARCPDEILLLIFKHFIVFNHSQIRRLLLVCKRWYNIVINSPHLWARIEINDALKLFHYKNVTLPSKIPYIIACYGRSRSLPLDVELDLTEFPSVEGYLKDELYRTVQEIADEPEHGVILESIYEHNWERSSKWIDNELSRTLEYILGANEVHVSRWKSLVLSLPDHEDIADRVWRRIRRASSNVVRLEIMNLQYDWEDDELDPQYSPSFPLLQHLTFTGTLDEMSAFIGNSLIILKSLDVRIDESDFVVGISILQALSNLRTLTLHIYSLDTEPLQLALPHLDIPQLESLTLYAVPNFDQPWMTDRNLIQPVTWKLLQRACMLHQAFPGRINWHLHANGASGAEMINASREITMPTNEASMRTLEEWTKQGVQIAVEGISERMSVKTLMIRSEKVSES